MFIIFATCLGLRELKHLSSNGLEKQKLYDAEAKRLILIPISLGFLVITKYVT
jgi:hypothetical protein